MSLALRHATAISLFTQIIGCRSGSGTALPPNDTGTTGSAGGGSYTPGGACADLSPERCGDRPDCSAISARPPHTTDRGICVDWSEAPTPLGCMSSDGGCGAAETWAAPPSDPANCWLFPSTCLPEGWQACDWPDTAECR